MVFQAIKILYKLHVHHYHIQDNLQILANHLIDHVHFHHVYDHILHKHIALTHPLLSPFFLSLIPTQVPQKAPIHAGINNQ